ncbi:MAG: hypothetical protein KGJ98_14105 [Chloroflexota bacterium]|nr:hypothetical protein [Chloroflexota bacterium]MDE3113876.1 hypothetical protein [Chloroflexota bacterium]MDE3192845.1 hypothetical protein [Chloroflexota bacterium]
MGSLRRFAAFWYDFIVGDDWILAAGALVALGLAGALTRSAVGGAAWLILPLAAVVVLWLSLMRATRGR